MEVAVLRFGPFEVDLRAGSLKKHGIRVRLPEQSFQILQLLLERRGDVVTREDVCLRLWPNHTIVEYDHSINTAVRRLRSALGETAEKPRYVETLVKRGYRFIAAVETVDGEAVGRNAPASRYRLLEQLGEGGMGVVYRAEDAQLGRHVAVKLLRTGEGGRREAAMRGLEQEARTACALNHPHICTIHGLEEIGARPAIVMELVEGETLAARLSAKKELGLPAVLRIARQIASALAEAHRAGVTHGDLKPANIMLTKNGVKVLDFGLARVSGPNAGSREDRAAGADRRISGTLHYMSPEHALGRTLDARSDVFSFGLLLYEMLSGRRAFEGSDADAVIAAIVERTPPPLPDVPAALARVVMGCLAKNPDARWQSGRELEMELERPEIEGPGATRRPRAGAWVWVAGAALAASLALTYGLSTSSAKRQEAGPVRVVPLTTLPGPSAFPAFSPDGQKVAFSWAGPPRADGGRSQNIHVKPVGNGDPVPLTDAVADDRLPQWSPDGDWIAFQRTTGRSMRW